MDLQLLENEIDKLKKNWKQLNDNKGNVSIYNLLTQMLINNNIYPQSIISILNNIKSTDTFDKIYENLKEFASCNYIETKQEINKRYGGDSLTHDKYTILSYLLDKIYTNTTSDDNDISDYDSMPPLTDCTEQNDEIIISDNDENTSESDSDSESEIIIDDDPKLEEYATELQINQDKIELRYHQRLALEKMDKQNYKSGINNHAVGSGKTILFKALIQQYQNRYRDNKSLYIICCSRKEILDSIFYQYIPDEKDSQKTKRVFKQEYFDKLKNSQIFDFNQFELLDMVNIANRRDRPNTITRPTIMLVNSQYLTSNFFKFSNQFIQSIKLFIFDECHSVSSGQFYLKVLRPLKYQYKKPIIGFSATPLRDTKAGKAQLIDIFSNECKGKVNIISTYDIADGIRDGVVLPFQFYTYTMEGNNSILYHRLLRKVLPDILKKLPYRKLIVWTRTIEAGEMSMKKWVDFFNNRCECRGCSDKTGFPKLGASS